MKNLIANRNFLLLYLGQIVSSLGSGINFMGLTLYTLSIDGGITNIALLLMVLKLPSVLFGPFAGVLADTVNRKSLVVLSDLARGIIGIVLFFNTSIIYFYILIFTMTLFDILFAPSISGMLPEIVSEESLNEANSLFAGSRQLTRLIGPALGGVLATVFGIKTIFILNGLSFILSGVSELFIEYASVHSKFSMKTFTLSYKTNLKEGFNYIKHNYAIKFIIIFFSIASITFGAIPILYIDYINNVLNVSPGIYGLYMSLNSLGLVLGSFITTLLLRKFKAYEVMIIGVGIYGLLFFIFSSMSSLVFSISIFFVVGIVIASVDVTYGIYLQKNVDNKIIGRVYSLDMALSNLLIVSVTLLMTLFGKYLNTSLTMKGLSLSMIILVIATVLSKNYKRLKLSTKDKLIS